MPREITTEANVILTFDGKDQFTDDSEGSDTIAHLTRHGAKYYFQPDQRDDYEQPLVDELGIASKTKNLA